MWSLVSWQPPAVNTSRSASAVPVAKFCPGWPPAMSEPNHGHPMRALLIDSPRLHTRSSLPQVFCSVRFFPFPCTGITPRTPLALELFLSVCLQDGASERETVVVIQVRGDGGVFVSSGCYNNTTDWGA